jgi:hypothetical protein
VLLLLLGDWSEVVGSRELLGNVAEMSEWLRFGGSTYM